MNFKIRAYDKKNKCFVKDLHNIRVRKNGEIYSQNKDIEIDLFSGKIDLSNKEIYENDYIHFQGGLYIVEFKNTFFSLRPLTDGRSFSLGIFTANELQVISNLHEEIWHLIKKHELT